jgi:hypothetical protein
MFDGLPTPRTTLRCGYVRPWLVPGLPADSDLQGLVDAGAAQVAPHLLLRQHDRLVVTAREEFLRPEVREDA